MNPSASPVFIVGSPRSGTSILTWSLGQHPNLLPLEESNWMGRFAVDLGAAYKTGTERGARSHLSAMGMTGGVFFQAFGEAVDGLILQHIDRYREKTTSAAEREPENVRPGFVVVRAEERIKRRWVDGTPEYSFHICGLRALFPRAKFVHIVRDVNSVVKSLMHFRSVAGRDLVNNEDEAYRYWLRTVTAACQAERALGSQVVLRIRYADLVTQPEAVLRRCLDFIGESFSPECLEPLGTRINSSQVPPGPLIHAAGTDPGLITEAEELSGRLCDAAVEYAPDPGELQRFEMEFANRVAFYSELEADREKALEALKNSECEREQLKNALADADQELARLRNWWLTDRIQKAADQSLPPGVPVVVIGRGAACQALPLQGRETWPLNHGEEPGVPSSPQSEITVLMARIEELRSAGAAFLIVPRSEFAWLHDCKSFHQHLDTQYPRVQSDDDCVIYHLSTGIPNRDGTPDRPATGK